MDAKERWLLSRLSEQLSAGTFDECDVLAFLILLRRHTRKTHLIRELGDFVAHRERDRGILQHYLSDVQRVLNGSAPAHTHHRFPISTDDLQACLNEVLRTLDLLEWDRPATNRLVVAIITLLQSVEIVRECQPRSKLLVGIGATRVALLGQATVPAGHGLAFPVLVADNDFEEWPATVTEYMLLDRLVESRSRGGHMSLEQRAPAA